MNPLEKDAGPGASLAPEKLVWLDPCRLAFDWAGGTAPVRLTIEGDRSYLRLFAACAFPQTGRRTFIELYEGKPDGGRGEPIGMLRDLTGISDLGCRAIEECLNRHYMVPRVSRLVEVRDEYHLVHFVVETDRGLKRFDIDDVYKKIILHPDRKRVILEDPSGNRYEIPDYLQLDERSRTLLETYL